jgi:3'-phosphoadenosine 5'-phosphosulfate sulfotransferase (PAPS reductase)/FAD synthetase
MTTQELISKSLTLAREALEEAKRPAVAWSGGKDSQVMLHLVRQVRPDVPVLHFRGFESAQKHFFADLMIDALKLDVMRAKPFVTEVVARGGHVEIIEAYRLNERAALYFPIEAESDHVPGPGSHCAVEKLNQPTGNEPLGVDCVFIGHRNDDVDPVHGAIPLERDAVEAGGVLHVYPLKDWAEANIWEASELLNIPQNQARYIRKDMDANADYFPMCAECLKPNDRESVICPKINEPVYVIGKHLNLERRREEWRDRFVNLQRTS